VLEDLPHNFVFLFPSNSQLPTFIHPTTQPPNHPTTQPLPPPPDVVIVSAARTPLGSFNGDLSSVPAPELGSIAIQEVMNRANLGVDDIDEVYLGNVVSAMVGQAPTKQAVLGAGLPNTIPCTTINKVCASGMKSVMMASQSIMLGQQSIMLAGGFENMSKIPFYIARGSAGFGHGKIVDGMIFDGLWDPYDDQHMGNCAEDCAKRYGFSREDQDAYAIESYRRAAEASNAGRFVDEIVPVTLKVRGKEKIISVDQEFSNIKPEKIPALRAAFQKDGTVTAANASSINDGACAIALMSADTAKARGLQPLARIRGFGDAAQEPIQFTTAPSKAVPIALEMAGLTLADMDYHEINEAFSVVALANMELMGLDHSRVNVNGGAVALGHPIGCSGARIITTLMSVLQQNDATMGTASICNGGGGASAIVIERL
jgi:acetyl-CoA C-acetyltransferase